jgi:DNA-binding CsgD family transcriptional regulator
MRYELNEIRKLLEPTTPPTSITMNKSAPATLSPRQQEVYDLLRAGSPRQEIAQKLGISLSTLKKRAKAGFRRLNAQTASEAAVNFYRPEAPSSPPASKEPASKEAGSKKESASKKEKKDSASKESSRPQAVAVKEMPPKT